ncbi:MAG: D-aminoacylase [Peptococcaceae bacterium]|jgi:N-acyl-D-aspartate/D-glutamate deacylase|nr:D-aminoacylase [Peptococcaceae bacterium]MDH7524723.1 D-aminoacylase [Peptococcaceae bacterium]
MLTRRQFLAGLGAVIVTTLLPLAWGDRKALPKDGRPEPKTHPELIPECDWVLDNVTIVDGTGKPGFRGKVGVKGEHITAAGDFITPEGCKVVDGAGLTVAPGFIDIHTHTEDYIYSGQSTAPFLSQGVTTHIGGNCGRSPRDIEGYLKTIKRPAINYGLLVGYRALRETAMGPHVNQRTSPGELVKMQELLAQAMRGGALGFSTGLEYSPQHLATTDELVELCAVVREYGGFYATHIRSEYNRVLPALEEAIEIGMRAGIPVQYSHIKAGYRENWDKFARLLGMLEEGRNSGVDITADVYPYTFSSMDIGTNPLRHSISEENMEAAVAHPLVFIASDSGIYEGGRASHPRTYGSHPRVLGRLVREKRLLSLEKAIAKMTSQPAKRLKLSDRGLISPGCKADLVLFDPQIIRDRATPENPAVFSEGVRQVWVNGSLAWSGGPEVESSNGQAVLYRR